jgi:NADPH-dependent 2,4-dienoyl-CoA reductase/sulfur reductase-like enzyme
MPTATREARVLSQARDQTPAHVLIAGGGVAGIEALLALHDLAGDRVKLTLLASAPEFVYRPMAIAEPFGRGRAEHHLLTDIVAGVGAKLVRGELVAVDGPGRTAITSTGQRLRYDALLVAIGAGSVPAFRRALTWTPETDAELFGGLLRDLEEGYTKRVAFVVPPGVAWTLPAYELALMTAWEAWGMGQDDVEVTVYTPEDAPLGCSARRRPRRFEATSRRPGSERRRASTWSRTRISPAVCSCIPAAGGSMPSASLRCRRRSDLGWRAFPQTLVGLSSPTGTGGFPTSRRCGRRVTRSPSRSSRAGSPPSRLTPPRRRSPLPWAPTSSRGRFARCCAG